MAKFLSVLVGKATGKVGDVVLRRSRGQNIVQSMPTKVSQPNTEAQQNVKARLKAASGWTRQAARFLKKTTKNIPVGQTFRNFATSNMFSHTQASGGNYQSADFEDFQLCQGSYELPTATTFTNVSSTEMEVTWDATGTNLDPDDNVHVVVLTEKYELISSLEEDNLVSNNSTLIEYPSRLSGEKVFGYLAITSKDGRKNSTSIYLGSFTLA